MLTVQCTVYVIFHPKSPQIILHQPIIYLPVQQHFCHCGALERPVFVAYTAVLCMNSVAVLSIL